MKNLKELLKNPIFVGVVCFLLGALSATVALQTKHDRRPPRPQDPFEVMRQQMMQNFGAGLGTLPGHGAGAGGSGDEDEDSTGGFFGSFGAALPQMKVFKMNGADIQEREDADFYYYEIPVKGLKNEKLNVKVEGDNLVISGKIDNQSDKDEDATMMFSSSFHRSLSLPLGTDPAKIQMENKKDRIVVKVPKR